VPVGYLFSVLVLGVCTIAALTSDPNRRSSSKSRSYSLGFIINEVPAVGIAWLAVATAIAAAQDDLRTPVGMIALGLGVASLAGLLVILRRALRARRVLETAVGAKLPRRSNVATLLTPLPLRPRSVERIADVVYGDAGVRNLLDVSVRRTRPSQAPTLIYFHGGSFRGGHKHREGRPLLHRLACHGWVCISANYRLSPSAAFPDHLIDVKRVIAWAREHAVDYGGDGETVFVAGGSAGGHLAAMAALTPNRPDLQPGFESIETSVRAAILMYPYVGTLRSRTEMASSPVGHINVDAPPFFVVHGDADTIVPVSEARRFVEQLGAQSSNRVVYAELPGAQHGFDVLRSVRSLAVVDAVEIFTSASRGGRQ
jgi:acetyl esterase/lipase